VNKYKQYFLYICVSVLVLAMTTGCTKQANMDAVITVNNSPVASPEFEMILKDNILQYEQALRKELTIPDSLSVLEYLKNDKNKYNELIVNKNIEMCKRIKIQQLLGQKYKISDSFDWNTFNKQLKKENQLRLKKIKTKEPVYGVQTFSQLQYYTYIFDDMVNKLIKAMSADKLTVTDEEILGYYRKLESPSTASGEMTTFTLCDVTAFMESSGQYKANEEDILNIKAQLSKGANGKLNPTAKNITFTAEQKTFSSVELRDFVKSDMNTEQIVLSLKVGEVSQPFYSKGKLLIARYDGLKKAEVLSLEDKQMIKNILQRKIYEEFISKEIVKAKVSINEKLLETIMQQQK
jgi:hypothetical protein